MIDEYGREECRKREDGRTRIEIYQDEFKSVE